MAVERWTVREHRQVARWLLRHPNYAPVYGRARNLLAEDPYRGEPLRGRCRGLWKLRVGELRLVYEVRRGERVVYVWRVGLRENIYEGLC